MTAFAATSMAAILPHRRPGRRPVRAERMQPDRHADEYAAALLVLLDPMRDLALKRLHAALEHKLEAAARRDAAGESGDGLAALLASLKSELAGSIESPQLASLLSDVGGGTAAFQAARLAETLGFSVDLLIGDASVLIQSWIDTNVGLVQTVAERFHEGIAAEVAEAFESGDRWEDLAERIAERFGVAESDAERIAVDQVGKLNGELNLERQTDLGVEEFIWRTSNDERVRPEHEELDGERFRWDDPPDEGIPGAPIRCRCYADPVLPGEARE